MERFWRSVRHSIRRVSAQGSDFWVSLWYCSPFWVHILRKKTFRGVNWELSSLTRKILGLIKTGILSNLRHRLQPNFVEYWKDETLSWPSWLTCSGRFTHINGHPSAAGRAQERESSPAKDRRSTTVPRHQRCTNFEDGSFFSLTRDIKEDAKRENRGSRNVTIRYSTHELLFMFYAYTVFEM